MSHLNAVTVLLAAFATRGFELKAMANQADSTISQGLRAVPQKIGAKDSGNLRHHAISAP
jgi:hypothetical protein